MRMTSVMRRGSWLALLAGATLLAWLAVAGLARADVSSLGIGSATVAPGESVTVNVTAEATSPGVGAYTVNVVYDGALLSATSCTSVAGVCNTEAGINTVSLTGANPAGLTGTVVLGTITFEAGATEGSADLDLSVVTLADPEGADISVTASDGSITIETPATPTPTAAPTATPTAAPTATPTPAGLPETGGPPAGSGSAGWVLAGLIGLGMAVLGSGAWAVSRARR